MANTEKEIRDFMTLVRELLQRYKKMEQELDAMKVSLDKQKKAAEEWELLATAATRDYDSLKMAKMLEVSDDDVANAQKRINQMIRDVNKCITLLSGQSDAQ